MPGSSFTVAATASSGLAVGFTSAGACTNVGATYTIVAVSGTCSVTANQPGNSNYAAAQATFLHGSVVPATGTLRGGTASFTTSALGTGTTNITASYAGDTSYGASSSTALKQVVDPSDTTTTLTSSVDPSTYKQAVIFTVIVTGQDSGTPAGSVTIYDGTTALKSAALSSGTVSIQISNMASGTHNLQATYKGNANFNTSNSAVLVQTVQ